HADAAVPPALLPQRLRPARGLQDRGALERRHHAGTQDLRPELRRVLAGVVPPQPREAEGLPAGAQRDAGAARHLQPRARPAPLAVTPPARPRTADPRRRGVTAPLPSCPRGAWARGTKGHEGWGLAATFPLSPPRVCGELAPRQRDPCPRAGACREEGGPFL